MSTYISSIVMLGIVVGFGVFHVDFLGSVLYMYAGMCLLTSACIYDEVIKPYKATKADEVLWIIDGIIFLVLAPLPVAIAYTILFIVNKYTIVEPKLTVVWTKVDIMLAAQCSEEKVEPIIEYLLKHYSHEYGIACDDVKSVTELLYGDNNGTETL